MNRYDIAIIGSGPGGYVAAIRAAQLNKKVVVIEKGELGGVCLNRGCIPTKALLKSAEIYDSVKHAEAYGVEVDGAKANFSKIIERSRNVASMMSKGVHFLFKKNKIDVVQGLGKIIAKGQVEVLSESGDTSLVEADNIIIATGAKSKNITSIPQDGKNIISYWEAMTLKKLPKSMVIVGSGAIGCEFACFYSALGTEVTIVEYMPQILPLEDEEASKQIARNFKKKKVKILTSTKVERVTVLENMCHLDIETKKGTEQLQSEIVLSAVGIESQVTNIGLENIGVKVENGKIVADNYYRTNIDGIYAIGDVVHGPALAHVASAEALVCIEAIAGMSPKPVNYSIIPSCVYTFPSELASVGLSEQAAIKEGYEVKIGKFPFTANGKAVAVGKNDGFVKAIFNAKDNALLGTSIVGYNATEMLHETVLALAKKHTAHDLTNIIHAHPTMSEAIMEAATDALGEAIHK
ncbi:MAG: dihydrolipoyl dehydrogenase [Bacteroidales bacterium]